MKPPGTKRLNGTAGGVQHVIEAAEDVDDAIEPDHAHHRMHDPQMSADALLPGKDRAGVWTPADSELARLEDAAMSGRLLQVGLIIEDREERHGNQRTRRHAPGLPIARPR